MYIKMPLIKELHSHVYNTLVRYGISLNLNIICKTLGLTIKLENYEIHVDGDDEQLKIFEPHLNTYVESLFVETIERKIPKEMCGLVIGKQGQTIKRIAFESGAKLQLHNNTLILHITGNKEQLLKANNSIDLILKQNLKMEIPSEKYGYVIGKGGKTIKKIEHISGANVSFKDGILSVYGTPECIQKAQTYVADIIGITDIVLNPYEYDKLCNGTTFLQELETKHNIKIKVNLDKYTLIVKNEYVDIVKKDIKDALLKLQENIESVSDDIIGDTPVSEDDDLFL